MEKADLYLRNSLSGRLLTIFVNPNKISRKDMWEILRKHEKIDTKMTEDSPYGIIFPNIDFNLHEMREFKEGYFEICDEGAQLLGLRVKVEPGDKVLDLSSSAGTRALIYGPYMKVDLCKRRTKE